MRTVAGIGLLLCIVFAVFISSCQAQEGFFLNNLQVNSNAACTRIFIPTPKETGYVVGELASPPQVILNLYPFTAVLPHEEVEVKDEFVQKICLTKESENVAKLVLSLDTPKYDFNIFSQSNPQGITLEIRAPREDIITTLLNVEPAVAKQTSQSLGPWQEVSEEGEKGRYRIVIDPGHGGKDPGAIGPSGLMEKSATFHIAKRLSQFLKQNNPNVTVYLTRGEDEFIPLDRRTEIANQAKGDLFISIHANAAWENQARGVETFYNSRYAYGEGAEEVAMRENASVAAQSLPSGVKNIIWDLIQNQYRQESSELARSVQEKLSDVCNTKNRGVKSAPFYVLRGASMPAILVEVGFISNPWEERKLKDSQYQQRIASGIYRGITAYIESLNQKVKRVR